MVFVKSKTELIIANIIIIYSIFHLYLPVLSQNEVFLSLSHERLNISTPFLFPSLVFFFWLLIQALSASDTSEHFPQQVKKLCKCFFSMGSEKDPSNRAIATGVGSMSSIGGVLASREVELCTPPALQELCMHCCSELVAFSRESC